MFKLKEIKALKTEKLFSPFLIKQPQAFSVCFAFFYLATRVITGVQALHKESSVLGHHFPFVFDSTELRGEQVTERERDTCGTVSSLVKCSSCRQRAGSQTWVFVHSNVCTQPDASLPGPFSITLVLFLLCHQYYHQDLVPA